MRPEAILPDGVDTIDANGVTVRKGSVGAFLASWRAMNDPARDAAARAEAEADLLALLPGLDALGFFEVFAPRDPKLAALVAGRR
ncbi:hypothetical protein ACKI2N_019930 [Cupriavidus sp. 30B13]|uniref:hypothetical protein n=1 Tax=Cupriavidus sp. 30B13 TaxID=3384241 RepID=UPI003B8F71AE